MEQTSLTFIRHAHAPWSPDENRALSARGQRDALRLAQTLAADRVTFIASSPYLRAIQTVLPLAERLFLPVQLECRFRERLLGAWDASSFREAVRRTWLDDDFAFPGGESNQLAQKRGLAALHDLLSAHPGGSIVVSTHGNLLCLLLKSYNPSVGYDFWSALTMPDIYRLELQDDSLLSCARLWAED